MVKKNQDKVEISAKHTMRPTIAIHMTSCHNQFLRFFHLSRRKGYLKGEECLRKNRVGAKNTNTKKDREKKRE